MKILNLGSLEILFILILALLILGPGRIVDSARSLGVWVRKITKTKQWNDIATTAHEVREFPRRILQEAGLDESLNEIKQVNIDFLVDETQVGLNADLELPTNSEEDDCGTGE